MAKKEYGELKKRAMLAKQRLRMGYWQQLQEERERVLSKVGDSDANKRMVSEAQRARLKRDTISVINRAETREDEKLYERVCRILDEDEDVMNPIGRLIEHEEYDALDDGGRQRYILELSKKYRELKERYYAERLSKTC